MAGRREDRAAPICGTIDYNQFIGGLTKLCVVPIHPACRKRRASWLDDHEPCRHAVARDRSVGAADPAFWRQHELGGRRVIRQLIGRFDCAAYASEC